MSKQVLSFEEIEGQTALELPDRNMLALVNIILVDVLSGNEVNVQVPVGIAANICGINAAAVLAIARQGDVVCRAEADASALPPPFQPNNG